VRKNSPHATFTIVEKNLVLLGNRCMSRYADIYMRDDSIANFGLLIAYLLPGFTVLLSATYLSDAPQSWLFGTADVSPTIGGFLYGTVASVLAGMTVSTVRWMVIDSLHHATGLRPPPWNFSRLQERVTAFELLVQVHYRYYQFYANMVVALVFALLVKQMAFAPAFYLEVSDLGLIALIILFFAGSRDTLRKYYGRVGQLLGTKSNRSRDAVEPL
jgi:hypothetical protein